jgi:hypothetical protein
MERIGTYYLNNSGTRWVTYPKQKALVIHIAGNYRKIRTIEYYESFGNFATAALRYKGKRVSAFLIEADYVSNNPDRLPVFLIDYKEKSQLC